MFDVVLNGDLTIASDLDVFERVGRGVAHDEYIEFEVKDGKILYEGDESEISAGKIRVEFIKSYRDNPKVNAIIVVKGSLSGELLLKRPEFMLGNSSCFAALQIGLNYLLCQARPKKNPSLTISKILQARIATPVDHGPKILTKTRIRQPCCRYLLP